MPEPLTVDWSSYAAVYDVMAEHNPAYQALVARFRAIIARWSIPPGATLADLGAGTGNFSLALATAFPQAHVIHVDSDPVMNALAEAKAAQRGLANITVRTQSVDTLDFPAESLAGVTSVHALYTFPDPAQVIGRMRTWLAPGGHVLAVDPGRPIDVNNWARYILWHTVRRSGLRDAASLFRRTRPVAAQNRRIAKMFDSGRYWTHDAAAFRAAFEAAGFEVLTTDTTYRDCSDLLVGLRPAARPVGTPRSITPPIPQAYLP